MHPEYLDQITVDMTDSDVQDIVRTAFGASWNGLNELEVWTHYDNALSYREKMSSDRELSCMIRIQQSLQVPAPAQPFSSLDSTPAVMDSPPRGTTPALEHNADFAPAFYHALEFSRFVLDRTQHTYKSAIARSHPGGKPAIPVTLSYQEIVDAEYIVDRVTKAMLNPCEYFTQSTMHL